MNIQFSRKILSWALVCSFLFPSVTFAQKGEASPPIDLQDLALPTDVKELTKQTGSVYYSTTTKNKPLMPVHFWGEVGRPGLHYIPVDSKLVKGLSFAGGGSSTANLEDVVVTRLDGNEITRKEFDLQAGGDAKAHEYILRPGDTVFIQRDRFFENRVFYTSLISVVATIISSIFIIRRIETLDRKN